MMLEFFFLNTKRKNKNKNKNKNKYTHRAEIWDSQNISLNYLFLKKKKNAGFPQHNESLQLPLPSEIRVRDFVSCGSHVMC